MSFATLSSSTQVFSYTKKKEIMTDDLCLDVSAHGGPVKLYKCHGMKGNQLWEYDKNSLAIKHVNSNQVQFLFSVHF